jgi:hypothetical protein
MVGSDVLHWDGHDWSIVPNSNGTTEPEWLNDVTVVSANDVWAVGRQGMGAFQTLAKHWDGVNWNQVPTPNADTGSTELLAVAGAAADDVWAVGRQGDPPSWLASPDNSKPFLIHWNGSEWSVQLLPVFPSENGALLRVVARSASEVWVLGAYVVNIANQYVVLRWDGSAWSLISQFQWNFVSNADMLVLAPDDIWVVNYAMMLLRPENVLVPYSSAWYWDGNDWLRTNVCSGCIVTSIDGTAPDDLWAAGNTGSAWHWSGAAWQFESTPLFGHEDSAVVLAFSAEDVWLLGSPAVHAGPPCMPLPFRAKLLTPANRSTNVRRRPRFDWEDVSGAHYYELIVRRDARDGSIAINARPSQSEFRDGKRRKSGTVFFWQARGCNNAGCGPWSKNWKFTIK